jgi:hypothetical protein
LWLIFYNPKRNSSKAREPNFNNDSERTFKNKILPCREEAPHRVGLDPASLMQGSSKREGKQKGRNYQNQYRLESVIGSGPGLTGPAG